MKTMEGKRHLFLHLQISSRAGEDLFRQVACRHSDSSAERTAAAEILVCSAECSVLSGDTGIYDKLNRFSVKVTLFVCSVTHHVMKAHEWVEVHLHDFLPFA